MLDRFHAGFESGVYAGFAMAVGADYPLSLRRDFYHGFHFRRSELLVHGVVALTAYAARATDLNDICARAQLLADSFHALVRTISHAERCAMLLHVLAPIQRRVVEVGVPARATDDTIRRVDFRPYK